MGVPQQLNGLQWKNMEKTLLKWMIWGYPHDLGTHHIRTNPYTSMFSRPLIYS